MRSLFFSLIIALFFVAPTFAQHHIHSNKEQRLPEVSYKTDEKTGKRITIWNLYITDTMVSYTGKSKMGMAINGKIPGPTLTFEEGDSAEIYVHNLSCMETSIHWHGLILPNRADGVPYLTSAPIEVGQTHLYAFPIIQTGTYWYHSHAMLQQQDGLYGAFIIKPKNAPKINEYTLLLSDWTNEKAEGVNRRLHNASDWYGIRKGSVQSYGEALQHGNGAFKIKLINEWKRMMAMDVSDVYYDAVTSNGKLQDTATQFKAGDKVRLHIVNGSSSTYFWLTWAGGKITVVENDGMPVKPVPIDKMIIGTAETYDLEVTIPQNGAYQFLATTEDRTNSTSVFLGQGNPVFAKPLGRLNYFAGMDMMNGMMKMDGSMDDMGMEMTLQQMDMNKVMYPKDELNNISALYDTAKIGHTNMRMMNMSPDSMNGMSMKSTETDHSKMSDMKGMYKSSSNNKNPSKPVVLNYAMLSSPTATVLKDTGEWVTYYFNLSGNMNRYLWTINNKTVSESDKILLKKGQRIKIILYNGTMMRHPMHLHGHFFRVLNGNGDYSPLKNTLDIMPMETDTLEFDADQSGDWFFHCHILYHMMSGMGRVFSYENSPYNPEVPNPAYGYKITQKDDKQYYPMAQVGLESNGSDGEFRMANIRNQFSTEWRLGLNNRSGWEWETHFGRYIGRMQWLMPYVGFDYRYRKMTEVEKNLFGQKNTKNDRKVVCAGFQYTLPMLFVLDTRIDSKGKLRAQLAREDIPITARLRLNMMANTDLEYMFGVKYVVTRYFSLSTHYDSDMGLGAGVTFNY